ncbi:MAG TPA: helix-turn-helix domain-containing GNAT family N-acetyltransferase [Rhizomicrobium sp.]|nr:helix-turn-helix domain-containing GNAT family N-acetyltransferase [Rhizomicrobium sp.]
MSEADLRAREIRRFNRFYTRQIGVLAADLLDTPYSLAEARLLYELAQTEAVTAGALRDLTGLDQGYLSRILAGFERRGLVSKRVAPNDGRARLLHLTAKGRAAFTQLDARAQDAAWAMLDAHGEKAQQDIVRHMQALLRLLSPAPKTAPAIVLRPPRPGDLGWVVHRQAVLYSQEYGWDSSYETLIADIVGKFRSGPGEHCWIAELDGAPAGTVFVMREDDDVARLRLLHVEPFARGNGLGRMLVDACVGFARGAGYKVLRLWTNDVLVSARRIYLAAGFTLTREEKHRSFGKDLVGQTWELML